MSDLIKRGKECAEAWFSKNYWPDAELVLELVAEVERLHELRGGWTEFIEEQQAEIERLEAELKDLATGNIKRWEDACKMATEIERLRAHIEWIGANTDSPSTALYCHAALEDK